MLVKLLWGISVCSLGAAIYYAHQEHIALTILNCTYVWICTYTLFQVSKR